MDMMQTPAADLPNASLPDDNGFFPYPQIVLFGDSITGGSSMTLQAWLQTRYSRRADVINRGFNGYTSQHGLSMLPRLFPTSYTKGMAKIKVLTLFFGANDANCSIENPTVPQVSLAQFEEALTKIVTYEGFTSHGTKIILITPPPVNEHQFAHTRLSAQRTATYSSVVRRVAQKQGLPIVDCWSVFLKHAGWEAGAAPSAFPGDKKTEKNDKLASLLSDGLHLTTSGYKLLFEELVEVISREVPDTTPETMPLVLSQGLPGFEWENLGATGQMINEGYPIVQADKDRIKSLEKAWEKVLGMTIEEHFTRVALNEEKEDSKENGPKGRTSGDAGEE